MKNEIEELKNDNAELAQVIISKNEEIEELKELKEQTDNNTTVNNNVGFCEENPRDIFSFKQNDQNIYISKYFGIGFIFEGELTEHFQLMETEKCGFGLYYVGEVVEPIKTFKVDDKNILKNEVGESIPYLYAIKDNLVLYDMKWFLVNISMINSEIWLKQINPYLEKIDFQFIDIVYQF